MAKIVKDDWEFKIERREDEIQYSAKYSTACEHGDLRPRGVILLSHNEDNPKGLPQFTEQEEAQILNFLTRVVRPKVEAYEQV